MLTDPQSITINSVAISLPKILSGAQDATYRSADRTVSMRTSHQTNKGRTRSMYRVDQSKIAVDPLTAENQQLTAGCYVVIDRPDLGFTEAELVYLITGMVGALSATSYALFKKLVGGES